MYKRQSVNLALNLVAFLYILTKSSAKTVGLIVTVIFLLTLSYISEPVSYTHLQDGSWIGIVEMPGGLQDDFAAKMAEISSGEMCIRDRYVSCVKNNND